MNFNKHSELEGKHSFLSASNYHWLNYDLEKLEQVYLGWTAKQRGTELHEFAKEAVRLGIRLPKTAKTLNMYVNDAIGFRLTPEQVLYYSPNCFGTADAIGFDGKTLRIHDLKTGQTTASMSQLMIYAAIFCLEYRPSPYEIKIELRIYQNDEVIIFNPEPEEIKTIIDIIIEFDKKITSMKEGR